jgi:hypothetical protein
MWTVGASQIPRELRRQMNWEQLLELGSAIGAAPNGMLGSGLVEGARGMAGVRSSYQQAMAAQQQAEMAARRQAEKDAFDQWVREQGVQDSWEDNDRLNKQYGLDEGREKRLTAEADVKRAQEEAARAAAIKAVELSGYDPSSPEYQLMLAEAQSGDVSGLGRLREKADEARKRNAWLGKSRDRLAKAGIDPEDPDAMDKDLALWEATTRRKFAPPASDPARTMWREVTVVENGVPMRYSINLATRERHLLGQAPQGGGLSNPEVDLDRLTKDSFGSMPWEPEEFVARRERLRQLMGQRSPQGTQPPAGPPPPAGVLPENHDIWYELVAENPGKTAAEIMALLQAELSRP